MYDYRVALSGKRKQGLQLRALSVLALSLIGEQLVHVHLIELTLWILVETADPDITDALTSQNVLLNKMCQERLYDR